MGLTHLTKANFEKEVVDSDIPVIVDFWASWCMPCLILGPTFEELSAEYEGKLKFAKLSTEEEQELAMRFQVMSIPTMIIFHKGQEVQRLVGALPKEMLKAQIDAVLGGLDAQ